MITSSNGIPSGPHFNLNIHGKKASYVCEDVPGGGSVFVLELPVARPGVVRPKFDSR